MCLNMSEKLKITAEDLMMLPEAPSKLVEESSGVYSFRYDESVDIVEQMRFVCLKYNQKAKDEGSDIRLTPLDFMVKSYKGKTVLIIKKTGKFKIARLDGFKSSVPKIIEKGAGYVMAQVSVYFEDNDTPFTDIGYSGRDEAGKDKWEFPTLLGTAVTRATLRAIGQHCVIDLMDEADYEQMAQNVENQIDAEDLRKVEKLTALADETKERKATQQEEAILQSKEITAQRKFDHLKKMTKKKSDVEKDIANILAVHNDDLPDQPPPGVMDDE